MKTLSTLYKKTSTGKLQYWKIFTMENVIVTQYGQVFGKEQETQETIAEGKNAGRSNATTAIQQAELEAQARWEKALKKGYVRTEEEAMAGKVDAVIEGGVAPMLAHKFSEQSKKINYPAFVQPKFDGHRCIAVVSNGEATLWTRTRKPITGLPHIIKDIEALAAGANKDFVLDGELYTHDYRENFEELSSFIRTPDPKPGHEAVQYHIYDLISNENQASRLAALNDLFEGSAKWASLVQVETREVASKEELEEAMAEFLEQGYEGLMVRNINSYYVNKRSYDLQKVKSMLDSEYEIVGVEAGRGKMADKAIFVCKTQAGTEFRVKMKGSLDSLKKYLDDPSLAIGKQLTVQYFGISNANEVPRFGVGLRIRED